MRPDGTTQHGPKCDLFGTGIYQLDIAVSHLYVGPHRNGEHYSLSLNVVKIKYEPQQNLEDLVGDLMNDVPPSTTVYAPIPCSQNVIPQIVQS